MKLLMTWFKGLKMRSQVFILQGAIAVLVTILLLLIYSIMLTKGVELIRESSNQVLVKNNNARISLLSYSLNRMINQVFNQIFQSMNKSQELYFNKLKIEISIDISVCPIYNASQTYHGIAQYHCLVNNLEYYNKSDEYAQKITYLTNQFDQFLLSLYFDNIQGTHAFIRNQPPYMVDLYPNSFLSPNYDVSLRSWYQEVITKKQKIYITDPFLNLATKKLQILVAQKIFRNQTYSDLFVGAAITFDNLNQYLELKNTKLVICTEQGIIVASNLINTLEVQSITQITYLFNQTYFPFSFEDWKQMIRYVNNDTYISNCKQYFVKFCRNIDGVDIQIEANRIQQKFILIIFNDLNFTQIEDNILSSNISYLTDTIKNYGIAIAVSFFGCITLSIIKINKIIRPAIKMIQRIDKQIRSQITLENNLLQMKNKNIFVRLKISYYLLVQSYRQFQVKIKKDLNKFQYPQLSYEKLECNLSQLIDYNQFTVDYKLTNRFYIKKFDQNQELIRLIQQLIDQ